MTPKKERVDLGDGKVYWEQYMTGKLSMQAIMQILGTKKVCLVAPERTEIVMAIVAKLQRELMEFHHQSIHNTDDTNV